MEKRNNGLLIEGFTQGCYNRMFTERNEVRNHPLTSWCQATVSGSPNNFASTKEHVRRTLGGLQYTLMNDGCDENLLTNLNYLQDQIAESSSLDQLADAISEKLDTLNRAFVSYNTKK